MIEQGGEILNILERIFGEVKGTYPQFRVNCLRCQHNDGLSYPDGKFNLEFNISSNKLVYKCWRCSDIQFSGSLGRLIKNYGTQKDYEEYKTYASIFATEYYSPSDDEKEYITIKLPEDMIYFSQMDIKNPKHFEAYNYLIFDRKLDIETILKYKLGFCLTGKYQNRIIIPSYDKNNDLNYFIGRSYIKSKYSYLNAKYDKNEIICFENMVDFNFTIYLCEGVFDALSLPNAIPLLGKTLSTKLFTKLNEHKPQVVIVLDPDAITNAINIYQTLSNIYPDNINDYVRIVKLPNNDDIDEIRRNKGKDEVIKHLYSAGGLTVDDYFIKKLSKPYINYNKNEFTNRRYDTNPKSFGWKSGITSNYIQ